MFKITVENLATGQKEEHEYLTAMVQGISRQSEPIQVGIFNDTDEGANALVPMGFFACATANDYLQWRQQQARPQEGQAVEEAGKAAQPAGNVNEAQLGRSADGTPTVVLPRK